MLPSANWWIKADDVDVVSSLEESVRLEWNGDVDLGDGELQKLYEEYRRTLDKIGSLLLDMDNSISTLKEFRTDIDGDRQFIHDRKLMLPPIVCSCLKG